MNINKKFLSQLMEINETESDYETKSLNQVWVLIIKFFLN